MKTLVKTTVIVMALTFTTLYAGGNHAHGNGHGHTQTEVNKDSIKNTANKELTRLVKYGKIDDSWKNRPILNMKKKQFHHNMEWVVSYKNKDIKDTKKQTLYIFVSLYGQITGANYTGK